MNLIVAGIVVFVAGVVMGTTKDTVDTPFWEFLLTIVLITAAITLAIA